VKLSAGKTELALLDPNTQDPEPKIILSAPTQERLSYPIFLNSNEIIFSWRKQLGQEHLYKINLASGKTEKILKEYPDARFPKITKEGLLFNSNKNGVQNLYLANSHLSEARPVSHSLTGLYMADMDPLQKEILATTMTSNGFNIASIDKKTGMQQRNHCLM